MREEERRKSVWGCMELDELDRELAEYNKAAEQPAVPGAKEQEKTVWTPFGEPDSNEEDNSAEYEMQYSNLERVKHKLEERLNYARNTYLAIEKQQKTERKSLRDDWLATACFLALLWTALMLTRGTPFFIAWIMLFVGLLVFTFRQIVVMLNRTVRYSAMAIRDNASSVVESHRLKTFAKQEEFQRDIMVRAQAQLEKVEGYRKKLETNRFLSEEDVSALERLGHVEEREMYYNNERFDLEDWFKLKKGNSSL